MERSRATGRGGPPRHVKRPRWRARHATGRERQHLVRALLVSLLAHALLFSLTFGTDDVGLPGIALPWQQRRGEVPELRVVLEAAPAVAAARATPPVDDVAPREAAPLVPPVRQPLAAREAPDAAVAPEPSLVDMPGAPAEALLPSPSVIALERMDRASLAVPTLSAMPVPVLAAAPSASSPASAGASAADAARAEAERREAARLAQARREAAQQEAAQQEAAQQEAALQEAALQEAKLEAARQAATKLEAGKREAEKREAELREAARQEATRQEAARQEATRAEAARQDAARRDAARLQAAQDDEHREAARRAMGRQLDEEAAQRAAAANAPRPPGTLPSSWSSPRRARLFGRSDANAELVLFAEAWARKIQLNTPVDAFAEAIRKPYANPVVTVAIRRDGSVESVTFVVASGVPELDEAVRRIVQRHLPYQPFSAALASEYDVVEIRRTWQFDMAVRLY